MESQYKGTVVGTMCALYKQPHGAFVLLPDGYSSLEGIQRSNCRKYIARSNAIAYARLVSNIKGYLYCL